MNEFALRIAISTLVSILASFVKNPNSDSARRLRSYVQTAHDATGQFLAAVPEPAATGE